MIKLMLSLVLALGFLLGCTNPFIDSFQRFRGGACRDRVAQHTNIEVRRSSDLEKDCAALIDAGFVMLGISCFVDTDTGDRWDDAARFGKQAGADVLLMWDMPVTNAAMRIPRGFVPRQPSPWATLPKEIEVPIAARAYCAIAFARSSGPPRASLPR